MSVSDWTPDSNEPPPMSATLGQAMDWMERQAFDGVDCPVCGRWTQVYTWSLRDSWINVMREAARDPQEWFTLADYAKKKVQNSALLRHWGLIERADGRREDGLRSSGKYRITDLGMRFLRGTASVPRQLRTFDGGFLHYVDEKDQVFVHEVLGYRFNFDAFMRGEG